MPQTTCVVPQCSNTGDHIIPLNKSRREAWIHAIRRGKTKFEKWDPPSKHSYVCKAHFLPEDYVTVTYHGTIAKQCRLKKSAVPSQFRWTKATAPGSQARTERCARRQILRDVTKKQNELGSETDDGFDVAADSNVGAWETVECTSDCNTDPPLNSLSSTLKTESMTQTSPHAMYSIENFRKDPAGVHFYTGLENIVKFYFVLNTLGAAAYCLKYAYRNVLNISVPDQFFLVLIKIRRHTTNFELSRMFSISESTVSNIVLTWICFMYKQWQEISIWPCKELVHYFAPSGFRSLFSSTRVIFDGTECPIKKPSNPKSQQATFSTYKNRNTMKVLVGATPGGLISFVSDSYAGSTSDRQIVERSSLTNMCDPGDSIMADKGFNVQDLFAPVDVTVNIPTFFRKKNRMTGHTVIHDRKIASKRVHIERLIGLAKTYKILVEPMSATEVKMSSKIIFICFMLCNFRNCIVPKNA